MTSSSYSAASAFHQHNLIRHCHSSKARRTRCVSARMQATRANRYCSFTVTAMRCISTHVFAAVVYLLCHANVQKQCHPYHQATCRHHLSRPRTWLRRSCIEDHHLVTSSALQFVARTRKKVNSTTVPSKPGQLCTTIEWCTAGPYTGDD